MRKCAELMGAHAKLQSEHAAVGLQLEELKGTVDGLKGQLRTIRREVEDQISGSELRMDQKVGEVRSVVAAVFCEFEVAKWSEVKEAALFSTATPLKAWSHEWWLKVEKAPERIGLYLCCGEDGRFPVSGDYQLMCRKRNTDEGVCASVVFRTEFGKEKAWQELSSVRAIFSNLCGARGLSKFTSLEQLEKERAYSRSEDRITFGCMIYPYVRRLVGNDNVCGGGRIRNVQWGRGPKRP